MKKLKIMFASVAFLFAIVASFASKKASSSETLVDYYRQISNDCQVENICDPFNLGDACEYTVYQERNGTTCQTPIMAYKPL
uniref:DUF6520 family protein n=1 Tax=Mariniflexile sp. TaxID=1979402 RepID=UPI00404861E4